PFTSNLREVWRYDLDGGSLLLNFEGEQFDASQEATRLVIGVLGQYLCDVDVHRCNLTMRATTPNTPLSVEHIIQLEDIDQEHLTEATTKDDNSLRTAQHLQTTASLYRLRDPATGELIALP